MHRQFQLVSWMVVEGGPWEMNLEPLARLQSLGCGKGQSAGSLGTVNEEVVCGHKMSQGLSLKNSSDSQMEGWREAVEAGRPLERLGSLPAVGDSGSQWLISGRGGGESGDSSTEAHTPPPSACWRIRSVGVQRGRLETGPQSSG